MKSFKNWREEFGEENNVATPSIAAPPIDHPMTKSGIAQYWKQFAMELPIRAERLLDVIMNGVVKLAQERDPSIRRLITAIQKSENVTEEEKNQLKSFWSKFGDIDTEMT